MLATVKNLVQNVSRPFGLYFEKDHPKGLSRSHPEYQKLRALFGPKVANVYRGISAGDLLSLLPDSFKSGTQMEDFSSFLGKNQVEYLREQLYSIKTYATGGYTTRSFFDETTASATNGVADTNMGVINSFPNGEAYLCMGVRVHFAPAAADYQAAAAAAPVAFKEWVEVMMNGYLELQIGTRLWTRWNPLASLPQGFGPGTTWGGAATVLLNVAYPSMGVPSNDSPQTMEPPVFLEAMRQFQVTAKWPAAKAVTTAGRLGVIFDGLKFRQI